MNFRVFWDVALCSHVAADRRFRDTYSLQSSGRTLQCDYITEDSKLHTSRRENLKSHILLMFVGTWLYLPL
jgi:hypothetical protein